MYIYVIFFILTTDKVNKIFLNVVAEKFVIKLCNIRTKKTAYVFYYACTYVILRFTNYIFIFFMLSFNLQIALYLKKIPRICHGGS